MAETRQGKCTACRVAYRWRAHKRAPLKRAYCGVCGESLKATSHLLKWPWFEAAWTLDRFGKVRITKTREVAHG